MNLQERRQWLQRNPIRQWRAKYSRRIVAVGMSRKAFANAVGCSLDALRSWEEGRNLPADDRSSGYLPDVARTMRMKEEDLIGLLKGWLNEKENGHGKQDVRSRKRSDKSGDQARENHSSKSH